ncbi:uncharacterized protein ACLA_091600 [Aspergillus clavatus NRRL 1]|uniref:C2H2-type domain-containing protein n=1 Tax=Aspergillus clavatus (strain ATCC 1007 / CBS 513.65 / DSM 816 / NCTC 3887 / NRRL 1 / QM 1276 / 107) TaxID=344612 RepID=A1CF13_ASPCL|nr:uncharacterized protein ACLA_091600 [Aspergillus clavatus NRRL 1]EAW11462.1 hypothetical protein ACLA_091600 [Aspergillus clavatus NRRL 1]
MAPQYLRMIDTILTVPGTTLEAEHQRRIDAIDAMMAFWPVEEGRPTPRTQPCRRPVPEADNSPRPAKRQRDLVEDEAEIALREAVESVQVTCPKQRSLICFVCLGYPNLSFPNRLSKYKTPGSLTRHFLRFHINPPWPDERFGCSMCEGEPLRHKFDLLSHAERRHGTVVKGETQSQLALEYQRIHQGWVS